MKRAPKRSRHRLRVTVAILLGLTMALVGLDILTASPKLCASCHELTPRVETWEQSAHAQVACVRCHQAPTKWYALPMRAVDRGRLLGRDTIKHFSGDFENPVDRRVEGSEPIADAVCLQCHDPNRKATSGFRILIDHAAHATRNGSCISYHVRTAHPLETRGKPLSLMAQCFTCHGTAEKPEASAECGVCHPKDYTLFPASHESPKWQRAHGGVVESDPGQCEMCHEKAFCTDCHGVEMPHPEGWDRGRSGHAVVAERDREICGRCHVNRPDMCTMCHHEAYDPSKGTWAKQHFLEVRNRGLSFCFDCHSPVYCVECHSAPGQGS